MVDYNGSGWLLLIIAGVFCMFIIAVLVVVCMLLNELVLALQLAKESDSSSNKGRRTRKIGVCFCLAITGNTLLIFTIPGLNFHAYYFLSYFFIGSVYVLARCNSIR